MTITHFQVTHNATGETWTEAFTPRNVHATDDGANEAVTAGRGLTYEQATRQIAIQNRAQAAHKQEFKYSLPDTVTA